MTAHTDPFPPGVAVPRGPAPVPEFPGAVKLDGGKSQVELLPFEALLAVGDVLTYGASKYSPNNWRKGMAWSRLLGAALRHLFAWGMGQRLDPESKLPHLAHAAACILFLLAFEITEAGTDDRFKV